MVQMAQGVMVPRRQRPLVEALGGYPSLSDTVKSAPARQIVAAIRVGGAGRKDGRTRRRSPGVDNRSYITYADPVREEDQ